MVYNGKSYENGWFGGTTILGNLHLCLLFKTFLFVPVCWIVVKIAVVAVTFSMRNVASTCISHIVGNYTIYYPILYRWVRVSMAITMIHSDGFKWVEHLKSPGMNKLLHTQTQIRFQSSLSVLRSPDIFSIRVSLLTKPKMDQNGSKWHIERTPWSNDHPLEFIISMLFPWLSHWISPPGLQALSLPQFRQWQRRIARWMGNSHGKHKQHGKHGKHGL